MAYIFATEIIISQNYIIRNMVVFRINIRITIVDMIKIGTFKYIPDRTIFYDHVTGRNGICPISMGIKSMLLALLFASSSELSFMTIDHL